ncbi:MAG: helix-turn-helix transcriptional regulator [Chloroflexia bacterium]
MHGSQDNLTPRADARLAREKLEHARQLGDPQLILAGLTELAGSLWEAGYKDEAIQANAEALDLAVQIDNKPAVANLLCMSGKMQISNGDSSVVSNLRKSVKLFRELNDGTQLTCALGLLGRALLRVEDIDNGEQAINESITLALKLNDHWQIAYNLSLMAEVSAARKDYRRAALLWSAAEANYDGYDDMLNRFDRRAADLQQDRVRRVLGEFEFEQMWAKGMQLLPEEALAANPDSDIVIRRNNKGWQNEASLTIQEIQVLQLLAQRLSDVEIAGRMKLSMEDVSTSIRDIYSKLNIRSRLAARRYALDNSIT